MSADPLLDSREGAAMFGVAYETFRSWWARRDRMPAPDEIRPGYPNRWRRSTLLAWGRSVGRLDDAGRPTVRRS